MTIPQVKNPLIGAAVIFIGLPLLFYGHQFYNGEIHTWTDITLDSLSHRTFTSFWAAIFWVFFRSPWASTITQLTTEATSTASDGTQTADKKVITLEQSAPPPTPPIIVPKIETIAPWKR